MLRLASFCRDEPGSDRDRARQLLGEACDEARSSRLHLVYAIARLRLAELDAEHALDGHGDLVPDAMDEFGAAAALLMRAGHAFGKELAAWSAAQLRMRYGAPDAANGVAEIAEAFARVSAIQLEHEVWAALFIWHTEHGDLAAAGRARQGSGPARRADAPCVC